MRFKPNTLQNQLNIMSFNTVVISPIIKSDYSSLFKTQESSLAAAGLLRAPGTKRPFSPMKEASGKYRTGLDKNALYINAMTVDQKKSEFALIDELIESLKKQFGEDIDFGPMSKVWNIWGNSPIKASPINASNEPIYLYPDINPQDLLNYCWARVHPRIAKSKESYERGECSDCQYYISDEQAENVTLYKKKKEINLATSNLNNLVPSELRKVAVLMGLPVSEETSDERVYVLLDNILKETEFKAGEFKGRNTVKVFNEISTLEKDVLEVKHLIEEAVRHNIYRTKGDEILEGNELRAVNKSQLAEELLNPEKQVEYLALKKRVANKKLAN